MKTVKPIKSYEDVKKFKGYYLERGEYRNYFLVSVCLNSALRICDVLNLKWEDFFNIKNGKAKTHLSLVEKKTDKKTEIFINSTLRSALNLYIKKCNISQRKGYIFSANGSKPLTRVQAYRIIKGGGESIGLDISCHSLRKTFGYHAWKQGIPPVMLMKIFNHSAFGVTKRYLCIEQEDKDKVFKLIGL